MVCLGPLAEVRRVLGRPPIAGLTGLKTHGAFAGPAARLHGVPLCVVGADLLGPQAPPVGRGVLAAGSHHPDFQRPRPLARGVPGWWPQLPRQRRPLAPPLLLQLADKVPARIPAALAQRLRRRPRIAQDTRRFPPQTMPRLTQEFPGAFAL